MLDLTGLHILVTRPHPQGEGLCQRIAELGGHPIAFPTIAFAPPPHPEALTQAIAALGEQDWLIFISPQAVYATAAAIRQQWPRLSNSVKWAAIGAGTAEALRAAGWEVNVQPEQQWNSEGLLNLPEFQNVTGQKVAVIRGLGGREWIDQALQARGAQVLTIVAYQRVIPVTDVEPILKQLQQNAIDQVIITSFEGAHNFKQLLGKEGWPFIQKIPMIVVSERIKLLAQDLGFQTIWVAQNASTNAIIKTCAESHSTYL